MSALRCVIIFFILVLWTLMLYSCTSRSTSPDYKKVVAERHAKGQAGGTFSRHRRWNYYQRRIVYAESGEITWAIADFSAAISQRDADQRMARTYCISSIISRTGSWGFSILKRGGIRKHK
jgi:hypothetical protein